MPNPTQLTKRETEIIELVAQKKKHKQIAELLDISERTVRNHLVTIRLKFMVDSSVKAAQKAVAQGLVMS